MLYLCSEKTKQTINVKNFTIMTKKQFISVFALMLLGVSAMSAAEIEREGNVFKSVSAASKSAKSEPVATPYKYENSKGEQMPIYLSVNGRAFVIMTSAKTGKQYKKYLGEEVSRAICKEMGKEYKEEVKPFGK